MRDSGAQSSEPTDDTKPYFTSKDLDRFETALSEAMAELERTGFINGLGARDALRSRLAVVIMHHANLGTRDLAALRQVAIESVV